MIIAVGQGRNQEIEILIGILIVILIAKLDAKIQLAMQTVTQIAIQTVMQTVSGKEIDDDLVAPKKGNIRFSIVVW